jgi:hypothetical protein
MTGRDGFFNPQLLVALLDRMKKLIEELEMHQRDFFICRNVDMYWYIQKQRELEILIGRVSIAASIPLIGYLDALCVDIQARIDRDEKFVAQHFGTDSGGESGPSLNDMSNDKYERSA